MATPFEGIPAEQVAWEPETGSVVVSVDEQVYPLEALYGASYVFIDRCFVFIDRPQTGRYRVTLSLKKEGAGADQLRALAGEFANELLSCAWRAQITKENRPLIESVTLQAIGGAMGPATLDDLASFDFTEQPFEDPLGIATSWEEKYKPKEGAAAETPAAAPAPAEAAPVPAAAPEAGAAKDGTP